jgi:hypothetical protein
MEANMIKKNVKMTKYNGMNIKEIEPAHPFI